MNAAPNHPAPARNPILKVIVLGNSGVGKTSLVEQFVNHRFKERQVETIGLDILEKTVNVGGTDAKLQIWDTAGQERFLSIAHNYYRGADCCVLVFDVTRHKTFVDIENWQQEFRLRSNICDNKSFPFVVLANKVDVEDRRVVRDRQVEKMCREMGDLPFFYVSSRDAISVETAFAKIAELALAQANKDRASLPDIASLTEYEMTIVENSWTNWCFYL